MAFEPISQHRGHHFFQEFESRNLARIMLVVALVAVALPSIGNEASIGDWTVHYSVFNSMFLQPEIAQRYGITRARSRSVLNVSIHNAKGQVMDVPVSGAYRNLLGQESSLSFRKVKEGDACYFIATFTADDREKLHFFLQVVTGESKHSIDFKKTVHHAP